MQCVRMSHRNRNTTSALKSAQTISPGGDTPFGERINLYTGELSFNQVDLSYDGTGPTIVLARTTSTSQEDRSLDPPAFGSWDLSIPRIETLLRIGRTDYRWGASENGYARCTQFAPPSLGYTDQWHGMDLVTEDGDRHPLLKRDTTKYNAKPTVVIEGQSIVFTAVTLDNWQIGCLPETANADIPGATIAVGEAFLVVSPNGTKYWMNYLRAKRAENVDVYDPVSGRELVRRQFATMYATKVEDRFGNYVEYHYTGDQLTSITASDGRSVTIDWRSDAPLIDSITQQEGSAHQRTWQYTYPCPTGEHPWLSQVTLPDQRFKMGVRWCCGLFWCPSSWRHVQWRELPYTAIGEYCFDAISWHRDSSQWSGRNL